MQIRFLLLFCCLFTTTILSATGLVNNLHALPNPPISNNTSCELPPPSNFHIIDQGPTSITFEFIPFFDAAPSRIKTYRSSDGFLLDNTVVPAGETKAKIANLPLSTDTYSTINSICEDGSDGVLSPPLRCPALILEIIVAGFQPGLERTCTIQSVLESCTFIADGSGVMTPFKISSNQQSRQFGVRYIAPNLQVSLEPSGNAYQNLKFYCDFNAGPPCTNTTQITVVNQPSQGFSSVVARLELSRNPETTEGILHVNWLAPQYQIARMGPGPIGQRPANPNTGDREAFTPSEYWASAAPNPFSNNLDVYLGENDAQAIHLQLYNLAGQKVLDQQFSGGQEQYSLSTSSLSPGFYMLRVEADGNVQTLKVIKSE